jgi:hypothetical protein
MALVAVVVDDVQIVVVASPGRGVGLGVMRFAGLGRALRLLLPYNG